VQERLFTFVAGGAEEDHITWQRNDVQLAVMEKLQPLKRIRGEPRTFTEKEYAEMHYLLLELIITLVDFDED